MIAPYRAVPQISSAPDDVAGFCQDCRHFLNPVKVIICRERIDALIPEPDEQGIIGDQRPDKHNAAGSRPISIEDQDPPAGEVPADLRARRVDGAVTFPVCRPNPEEGAGFRFTLEDTGVGEEIDLVAVKRNICHLTGVLVEEQEGIVPAIFLNPVNKSEMAAALPALGTLENQRKPAPAASISLLH